MAGGSIQGVVGQIMWSYYKAALLEGYTVTRSPTNEWTLRARVVPGASDAFKLAQRPLVFVAPTEHGAMKWPIESLQVVDGALTAQLGPPEGSHV